MIKSLDILISCTCDHAMVSTCKLLQHIVYLLNRKIKSFMCISFVNGFRIIKFSFRCWEIIGV